MEAAAIPVMKDGMELDASYRHHHHYHQHHAHHQLVRRQLSGRGGGAGDTLPSAENSLLFGGHPAPGLDTSYQVSVKDNRDSCHAISMMKVCRVSMVVTDEVVAYGGARSPVSGGR